eukprot:TRINITY_DN37401_c0_g1_i2.p1 TRINITY_DN37401_c0_g1~~TRINITY_DN37401_c0_g1_i2.p1  ORF type:complete len:178 (+),score=49.98 TRINITY_DN37401_c0_g1_i2:32-565(+)
MFLALILVPLLSLLSCTALQGDVLGMYTNPSVPEKRTYLVHRGNNGKPRYTSLVRRNFLRFGKRSGGDAIEIPEEEGTEEMEENEKLNKFISFFQHFNAVPLQQEIPEEIEEDQTDYPDFSKEERGPNFIRFGKRAQEVGNDYNNDFDYNMDTNGDTKWKRSGRRRKMSNFLRFGRR